MSPLHNMSKDNSSSAPFDPFEAVAAEVRTGFARKGHRISAFPEVAVNALARINPAQYPKQILIEQALARLNVRANRACFHDAENVVPVYADDQFILTFHMWAHTFGNPHSHRWSGAFQSLSDPLVYVDYAFDVDEAVDNDLHFGRRRQIALAVQERGAVTPVEQDTSIHGFGHSGLPGLTLAIRARSIGSQTLDYWGDGLRLTTGANDEVARNTTLIARTLRSLRIYDEEAFHDGLTRTLAANTLRSCVMLALDLVSTAPAEATSLSDAVLAAHPCSSGHAHAIRSAIEAKALHHQVLTILESCHTPRERLLIALLRFCEDRQQLTQVVSEPSAYALGVRPETLAEDYTKLFALGGRGFIPDGSAGRALLRVFTLLMRGYIKDQIIEDLQSSFHLPHPDQTVAAMIDTIRALALPARLLPTKAHEHTIDT